VETRSLWLAACLLLDAAAVVGCGTDVIVVGPRPAEPMLPPDAAPALEGCPEPLLVPPGAAWIGGFTVWPDGSLTFETCDKPHDPTKAEPPRRIEVAAVFIDSDELTNGCYRHCVEEGVCLEPVSPESEYYGIEAGPQWDSPELAEHPALVDESRAEAFCAWRGGRVPRASEFARAAHGDLASVTTASWLAAWMACADSYQSEQCEDVRRRAMIEARPYPIRADARDLGPFGHWDLHGSKCDLTTSRLPWTREGWCASLDEHQEPAGGDVLAGWCPAWSLVNNLPATNDVTGMPIYGYTPDPGQSYEEYDYSDGPTPFRVGFRCAYDPVPSH
jgi:formylglycine-generating enzyme required for sulfatase activity